MVLIYKRGSSGDRKRLPWCSGYADEPGERRTVQGFTDKGEAYETANGSPGSLPSAPGRQHAVAHPDFESCGSISCEIKRAIRY